MRRPTLLTLILAAALSACQSPAMQGIQAKWQQAFHPCPSANLFNLLWSPDGKQIAFASEISGTVDASIVNLSSRSITRVPADGSATEWSSDGSRLIWDGLQLANLKGPNFLNVNSAFAINTMIWSPDGTQVALVADKEVASWAIYTIDSAGTKATEVYAASPSWAQPRFITWSPDGKQIAFQQAIEANEAALIVMNSDGSNVRAVSTGTYDGSYALWSPDGQYIAFLNGENQGNLNIIRPDGTGLTQLTTQDKTQWPFAWISDGSGLLVLDSTDYTAVKLINIGLNQAPIVIADLGNISSPAFSPDAAKLAFISREKAYPDLYVMEVDGTNKVRLVHNPGYQTCFDWPF